MFCLLAETEKGFQDRLLPISPEFYEMLMEVNPKDRTGFVFNPIRENGERFATAREAGPTIRSIGKAAGVVVDEKKKSGKTVLKYASVHDLRRSFGTRWSSRVMPMDLMLYMRHESIETTMKYYLAQSAEESSDRMWDAFVKEKDRGDTLGDTTESTEGGETGKDDSM